MACRILAISACILLTYSVTSVSGQQAVTWSKPLVLGRTLGIHSKLLNQERILNIYLPEGYTADDTTRYPVIFLLDGAVDEDFIHIAGLVQFHSFEWVRHIPRSILVGIGNVDRRHDFTFPTSVPEDREMYPTSGGSEKFITFIQYELIPLINSEFRTNDSRMIIAQSLGALLLTEMLFKKPYLFNQYVIVSPSLWWDNGSLLRLDDQTLNLDLLANTCVYLAVGKEGLTPGPVARVMEVDVNQLADKLRQAHPDMRLHFDYLPSEDHGTILHQAVSNAFRFLGEQK